MMSLSDGPGVARLGERLAGHGQDALPRLLAPVRRGCPSFLSTSDDHAWIIQTDRSVCNLGHGSGGVSPRRWPVDRPRARRRRGRRRRTRRTIGATSAATSRTGSRAPSATMAPFTTSTALWAASRAPARTPHPSVGRGPARHPAPAGGRRSSRAPSCPRAARAGPWEISISSWTVDRRSWTASTSPTCAARPSRVSNRPSTARSCRSRACVSTYSWVTSSLATLRLTRVPRPSGPCAERPRKRGPGTRDDDRALHGRATAAVTDRRAHDVAADALSVQRDRIERLVEPALATRTATSAVWAIRCPTGQARQPGRPGVRAASGGGAASRRRRLSGPAEPARGRPTRSRRPHAAAGSTARRSPRSRLPRPPPHRRRRTRDPQRRPTRSAGRAGAARPSGPWVRAIVARAAGGRSSGAQVEDMSFRRPQGRPGSASPRRPRLGD
jgi:hypothetical protein